MSATYRKNLETQHAGENNAKNKTIRLCFLLLPLQSGLKIILTWNKINQNVHFYLWKKIKFCL